MKGTRMSRGITTVITWVWTGVLASLILTQTSAWAQGPPVVELSGGYAFLTGQGDDLPLGIFASAAWRATRRIALVGQVSASFDERSIAPELRSTRRARTFLGGAQVNVLTNPRIEPFVQILAGASHFDARVWETGPSRVPDFPPFDIRLDTTDFALRLGGGLTWWLHPRVGAQIGAHYQRTFDRFDFGGLLAGYDADEFEMLAGATIGFARRP